MPESKNLKTAVDKAVKSAESDAKTGNVTTSKAPPQVKTTTTVDLPSGTRRGLPPE